MATIQVKEKSYDELQKEFNDWYVTEGVTNATKSEENFMSYILNLTPTRRIELEYMFSAVSTLVLLLHKTTKQLNITSDLSGETLDESNKQE